MMGRGSLPRDTIHGDQTKRVAAKEGSPVDRLSDLLGEAVQFSYTALDRIVLNGYIERLQRPENLVYFFHDVVGIKCIEPAVLMSRTDRYRDWVHRYTEDQRIPVFQAPKGERKEDLVLPYYERLTERLTEGEGVACVLTSMEQGRTFVSYTPRFPPQEWRRHLPPHQGLP
jgi:hypothetical protein